MFESGLATPVPKPSLYDTLRAGSNAAVFESLQSQLKTRDGITFLFITLFIHSSSKRTLADSQIPLEFFQGHTFFFL